MFNKAYTITFSISNLGDNGDDTDKENFYKTYLPNWKNNDTECDILNVDIYLLVYIDQFQCYLAQGKCDFSFKICNDGKWRMTIWRDRTSPD
ncbi:MAG: hypothetical protein ACUVWP_04965 [bacterium]